MCSQEASLAVSRCGGVPLPGMASALVTGAASGIGREIAHELARRGATLFLTDIDETGLAACRTECTAAGSSATCRAFDLRERGASVELVQAAETEIGEVDAVYNVAGVAVVARAEDTDADDWRWVLDVNLHAPIAITNALLPAMTRRGRGRLVFVASLAGLIGTPGLAAYTTSKFGLVGYAESLRAELAGDGISVTTICPGYVRTGLIEASRYRDPEAEHFLRNLPTWLGLSAKEVARKAIDKAESGGGTLALGPERLLWWLKRLSPESAHVASRWITAVARRKLSG